MRYAIVTFGCRVNQADSLRLEEDLRARGASAAPSHVADLVIVNTCSVTATADQGARQTIRRVARENPSARIVVTGCYATRSAGRTGEPPRCDPRRQERRQARSGCRPRAAWRDLDRRTVLGTATGRVARASNPGSRGGRHSRCGSRPAARNAAAIASSRPRVGPAAAGRSRRSPAKSIGLPRRATRRSPSPAFTSVRTGETCGRDRRSRS